MKAVRGVIRPEGDRQRGGKKDFMGHYAGR